MKRLVTSSLFLLCLFCGKQYLNYSQSQPTTHAYDTLNTHIITEKIADLKQTIKRLKKVKDYDSIIISSLKIATLSVQINDSISEASAYARLGFYYEKQYNYEAAFNFSNRAYLLYSKHNDSLKSGRSLLTMGYIQKHLGDYVNSNVITTDALGYLIPKQDYKYIASAYHLMAVNNKELRDYENATHWNQESIKLAKDPFSKKIRPINFIKYLNTKANILRETQNYTEAISLYKKLLTDSIVKNNLSESSRIKDNLGYTKWLNGPSDLMAFNLMQEAYNSRKERKSFSGLISSNLHLAEYYSNKNIAQAIEYASAGLENAQRIKNPVAILESLDQLVTLKKEVDANLTVEAILQSEVRNELTSTTQKNRRIYADTKFRNQKLAKENATKTLEALKQRNLKNIFVGIGVFLALSVVLLYFYWQQKGRLGRVEERYRTEKRLSKKIHDELSNDIFYLMTQIQNNPNFLEKKGLKVLDGLQGIYSKARDISREYSSIDTGDGFIDELLALLNSFGSATTKIVTSIQEKVFWEGIHKNTKIEVFRLVQELLTNMKKHSEASLVAITFSKNANQLFIKYKDNGIGAPAKNPKLTSVENRMQVLKGKVNLGTNLNEGFSINLSIPI